MTTLPQQKDFFLKLTERLMLLLNPLRKSAQLLYQYLAIKRPLNTQVEIDLKGFTSWSDYTLETAKKSLSILVEKGFLHIIQKCGTYWFKAVAFSPDAIELPSQNFLDSEKMPKNSGKMSKKSEVIPKKSTSNPCADVSLIENSNTTNTNPPAVVFFEEEEYQEPEPADEPLNQPKTEEISAEHLDPEVDQNSPGARQILEAAEDAGVRLHPQLIKFILSANAEVVRNAIALTKANRQTIKNPGGYLRGAIEGKWTLATQSQAKVPPQEFVDWYEWAIAAGLVEDVPISYLPQLSGSYAVRVRVSSRPGMPPFEIMAWKVAREFCKPIPE